MTVTTPSPAMRTSHLQALLTEGSVDKYLAYLRLQLPENCGGYLSDSRCSPLASWIYYCTGLYVWVYSFTAGIEERSYFLPQWMVEYQRALMRHTMGTSEDVVTFGQCLTALESILVERVA